MMALVLFLLTTLPVAVSGETTDVLISVVVWFGLAFIAGVGLFVAGGGKRLAAWTWDEWGKGLAGAVGDRLEKRIRSTVADEVEKQLTPINRELAVNGGETLKDLALENRGSIAELQRSMEVHTQWHQGRGEE